MTGAKGGVFEPSITLKKPYSICGMGVLLENYKTMGQAQTVCKELLTTLTKDQLVTFANFDGTLARTVLHEQDSGKLLCMNPVMQVTMNKLLERLRKENVDSGNSAMS